MKKLLLISLLLSITFLGGCSNKTSQEISIIRPMENNISKQGNYALDCKTTNYTSIVIGGKIMNETYVKVQEGHERDTLYITDANAKYFGADYDVIQDDSSSLVIMRAYSPSGLTEIVTINKESGIGFDTKTLSSGISGGPNTHTYILSCTEV